MRSLYISCFLINTNNEAEVVLILLQVVKNIKFSFQCQIVHT